MAHGLRLLSAVVLALVFASAAYGCARDEVPTTATDKLVIGVAVALTGDLAAIGATEQNATRVAEQVLNASGGILGRPLVFQIVDDGTKPATFRAALDTLLPLNPAALIGPTGSPQAIDGQDRIFKANLLQISASASTPTMTTAQPKHARTFFRTAPSHDLQARAMAVALAGGSAGGTLIGLPRCSRAIVIHSNDDYGSPIAQRLAQYMGLRGGSVVLDIPVPSDVKASYEAEAQQVIAKAGRAMGADCQVIVAFPPTGANYMLSFGKITDTDTSRDWKTFITFGSNGVFQQPFIEGSRTSGGNETSRANGVFGIQAESNPPTPQFGDFKNLYQATFPGAAIPAYGSNQFDAAILLALAMQRAGTVSDTAKIRDALFEVSGPPGTPYGPGQISQALAALRRGEDIDYQGASGDVDFDEYGDVRSDYILWKVQNGAFSTNSAWRIQASELR